MAPNKTQPIAIIGSGAWGLSTALHLTNSGHSDITVFDQASEIPSKYSAAYDLNKIVRAEYEDEFYTKLALEAINTWKTPLWGPYFHQAGYVVATSSGAPEKATHHLQAALETIKEHPVFKPGITPLNSSEDFRNLFWQFTGPMDGFTGYHNRLAGYAHSSNAMKHIYYHLAGRGVKFILGPQQGNVTELIYSKQQSKRRCTGFKTADGKTHRYGLTVLCAGPYAAKLVPSVGDFVVAKSWSVTHVQLTEPECDYLRNLPVLNVRDLGFFFEPDPATRLFKICPLGAGFINTNKQTGISLPPSGELPPPQDYLPAEDEKKMRRLLQQTLPWMADRPFVESRMCWFADTADSEYCVDFVPDTDNSLVVLSGDSGHGFKMMPIVGKWVLDLLNDGKQNLKRWQFKVVDPSKKKAWGDEVSWRIGSTKEIEEVIQEQKRMFKARL